MVSNVGVGSGCDVVENWDVLNKKVVQRGSYVAWNICAKRNRFVFENNTQPLAVVSQRVERQVEEYNEYTTRIY